MKTLLLTKYIDRLASLNDQLCFYQFSIHELEANIQKLPVQAGNQFTNQVFPGNIMAPRIHVKVNELIFFRQSNESVNFGTYYSISYEVFSNYLNESLSELQNFSQNIYHFVYDKELEEKYILTLSASGCPQVANEIIQTIKYIRLRRNHFTHLADTVSSGLTTLIQNFGNSLNLYWSTVITNLDFSSLNVLKFSEAETIDLIKLIRIILQRLDKHIATCFSETKIVEFLANSQFTKPQRLNTDIISTRVRKVKTLCKMKFDTDIDISIIEPIVASIAKR